MKNPAVKFAVYAFAFSVVWTLIQHLLGYNTSKHEIGQYTRMLGSFVFYTLIIFAILEQRSLQSNTLNFGQGLQTGSLLSLLYSVGISCWYAIYGEIINPQYKSSLMAFERNRLESLQATPQMIAAKMKEVDLTSGGSFLSYLLLFVFMGLFGIIIAAIASFFLKRKKGI